jgi:hypothetical protein
MIQYDITKWTMDDVYGQHVHVHPLTIRITFATIKYPHLICFKLR